MIRMKSLMMSLALSLFMVLAFSSCQTKQHAIGQLENFSKELRDNGANYDVSDWKDAAQRFQKIRKNIEKHEYTAAERKEIGQLEGQCAGYFVSGVKQKLTNGILGIGGELKGILEGILESVSGLGIDFSK